MQKDIEDLRSNINKSLDGYNELLESQNKRTIESFIQELIDKRDKRKESLKQEIEEDLKKVKDRIDNKYERLLINLKKEYKDKEDVIRNKYEADKRLFMQRHNNELKGLNKIVITDNDKHNLEIQYLKKTKETHKELAEELKRYVEALKDEETKANSQAKKELEWGMKNYKKNEENNNLSKEILRNKLTKEVITNEIKNIKKSDINKRIESKEAELRELQGISNTLLFEQDTMKAYTIPELEQKASIYNVIDIDTDEEVLYLRKMKEELDYEFKELVASKRIASTSVDMSSSVVYMKGIMTSIKQLKTAVHTFSNNKKLSPIKEALKSIKVNKTTEVSFSRNVTLIAQFVMNEREDLEAKGKRLMNGIKSERYD